MWCAQDRQDSDTNVANAAGGSIINSKNNATITASDTANLSNRSTVPGINYGYKSVKLSHDRLGHVERGRLKRTKNRSAGLEKLFRDYKPEDHPLFC